MLIALLLQGMLVVFLSHSYTGIRVTSNSVSFLFNNNGGWATFITWLLCIEKYRFLLYTHNKQRMCHDTGQYLQCSVVELAMAVVELAVAVASSTQGRGLIYSCNFESMDSWCEMRCCNNRGFCSASACWFKGDYSLQFEQTLSCRTCWAPWPVYRCLLLNSERVGKRERCDFRDSIIVALTDPCTWVTVLTTRSHPPFATWSACQPSSHLQVDMLKTFYLRWSSW